MVVRGHVAVALVLGALAGCDAVFSVDHLYECPADDDDCDKLLNRDDPCPGDAGNTDDQDGDGVGDDCDPHVAMNIDQHLVFDGLVDNDGRWGERGAAAFHMHDSSLLLDTGAVERAVPPNSEPTVEVVIDPTWGAEGGTVGVFVASKSSTGIPLECRVEHHEEGDDLVVVLIDPNTLAANEVGRARGIPGGLPGDPLRIYGGQLANFSIRCRARYGISDSLFVDWAFFSSAADFDTIGFHVTQASASYHAVTIFTTVR